MDAAQRNIDFALRAVLRSGISIMSWAMGATSRDRVFDKTDVFSNMRHYIVPDEKYVLTAEILSQCGLEMKRTPEAVMDLGPFATTGYYFASTLPPKPTIHVLPASVCYLDCEAPTDPAAQFSELHDTPNFLILPKHADLVFTVSLIQCLEDCPVGLVGRKLAERWLLRLFDEMSAATPGWWARHAKDVDKMNLFRRLKDERLQRLHGVIGMIKGWKLPRELEGYRARAITAFVVGPDKYTRESSLPRSWEGIEDGAGAELEGRFKRAAL